MPFNLNIILDSPAVICDKDDCYHIMIPDLLDEHRPPGISGLGEDGTDFARGMYEIAIRFEDNSKKGGDGTMYAGDDPQIPDPMNAITPVFDIVPATIPPAHGAYVVLKVPKPDRLHRLSPVTTTIQDENGQHHKNDYTTRVVLRYLGVKDIEFFFGMSTGGKPDTRKFHRVIEGEAYLTIDMRPLAEETVAHFEAGYRAGAKMIGLTRLMTKTQLDPLPMVGMTAGTRPHEFFNVPHKSCKSPLILVRPHSVAKKESDNESSSRQVLT